MMRTLTTKSIVALGLVMSLSAMAHPAEGLIKEKGKKVTELHLENVSEGSILTIKDTNGLVLYTEAIEKSGDYTKGFDLTSLPNGDYFFELNSELRIEIIPFAVDSSDIAFNEAEKEMIYKPVIRQKEEMVYLWKPTLGSAPLNYTIYYADNHDFVLSEDFEQKETVNKAYDFSKAKKGNYVFVFESKGIKFTKMVKI